MARILKEGGVSATLLSATITTAVTGVTTTPMGVRGASKLMIEQIFTYGSGGTTANFYIQTRTNGGTWRDIANFSRTTSSSTNWHVLTKNVAVAPAIAASDAALAANTILDGFIGDEIRVKYTTTGTYAGNTTIVINLTASA